MQGIINKKAGKGFNIQGIIEEYQVESGGNVSAGDFVSYINELTIGNDSLLNITRLLCICCSIVRKQNIYCTFLR